MAHKLNCQHSHVANPTQEVTNFDKRTLLLGRVRKPSFTFAYLKPVNAKNISHKHSK
jgi:hypothetical protein